LFEFTLPTENAPQSPRSFAASIVAHGLAIVLLFAVRFSGIARFPEAPQHFTMIAPAKEMPIAPPPKARAPRPREFRPQPATHAQLEIPVAQMIPAPAIEIPHAALPEIPRPATPAAASVPAIKPSGFTEAKPLAPAPAPKQVVKAAGFESSETSQTGAVRRTLTALGSFESAHSAEGTPVRNVISHPGGFSDASAEGTVAARRRVGGSAAFGDAVLEKTAAPLRPAMVSAPLTPIEIISKPKPAYTPQARAKNIEGEVLLEAQFSAAGEVRVLRVVRGLGFGLDETAAAAAREIRFRPATRDGAAVDSTGLVHIVFQLAN
jgi:TonB family protein